jgi:hypothetical protein
MLCQVEVPDGNSKKIFSFFCLFSLEVKDALVLRDAGTGGQRIGNVQFLRSSLGTISRW